MFFVIESVKLQNIHYFSLFCAFCLNQASLTRFVCWTTENQGSYRSWTTRWWRWGELLDKLLLLVTDAPHLEHVCLSVEHSASCISWPTAAVHGTPAAGGLEVESSWRPSPWHRYIRAEKCLLQLSRVCVWELQLKYLRVCETDIPMSVGIVEPKTHSSQLNAAEFLWDLNKRTSVFVQVEHMINPQTHTSPLSFMPSAVCASEFPHQTHALMAPVSSRLLAACRCTASAQNSLPGSTVERRASPSGSSSTRSLRETVESTQNTSTLHPAKSKSSKYTLSLIQRAFFTCLWLLLNPGSENTRL